MRFLVSGFLQVRQLLARMQPNPARSGRFGYHWRLWFSCIGLIAIISAQTGYTIWHERERAFGNQERNLANLSVALGALTTRYVASMDSVIQATQTKLRDIGINSAATFRNRLPAPDIHDDLVALLTNVPGKTALLLFDANGSLVNSSRAGPVSRISAADREFFTHFRDNDDPGLYISPPTKSLLTGKWTIFLARHVVGADGRFIGVITMAVGVTDLENFYRSIVADRAETIALLRRDGLVLTRYPDNTAATGTSMPKSSPWYGVVARRGGAYLSPGFFGAPPSVVIVRPLPGYDLVISVIASDATTLAPWREEAAWHLFFVVMVAPIFIVLFWMISRQSRLQALKNEQLNDVVESLRTSELALRESEERLALATTSAGIGIWDWDVTSNTAVWDARMYELYGIDGKNFSGAYSAWRAGVHPDDRAAGDAAINAAIEGAKNCDIEFRVVWPNGEVHRIESHATPLELVNGRATRLVGVNWDITERKQIEEKIEQMARHDALTGLANRHVFVEALNQAIARSRRGVTGFAILYLDLDHFKDVNDTLGHPVGDQLLQAVAARLLANVRASDVVARFGGDEFAILLADIREPSAVTPVPGVVLDDNDVSIAIEEGAVAASVVAREILATLDQEFVIQGNHIHSGTSVGIAVYGFDAADAETMLSHADVALYRAKSEARGTYRFFDEAMNIEVHARVVMNAEFRNAIGSDQLFLMYQPQVAVESGRIVGLEALVRWHHPTRGILGPDNFIPAAETSGLIVPMTNWAMREACRQARQWIDAGIVLPVVAMNLSGLQFKRPLDLEDNIATALAESGVPARLLELELTETVLMEASQDHNDLLIRLRKEGHRIAIDDFGSGYSSLSYLRRFPVDRIKIAQTFVRDIGQEAGSDSMVKAALGLARELGIEVVVEGVETAAQLALLKGWGCRIVQGFYFSRPLPVAEMTDLLRIGNIAPTAGRHIESAAA